MTGSRLAAFSLVVGLVMAIAGCGSHNTPAVKTSYYLALGDSLSIGYQTPHIPTDRNCTHPKLDTTGSRGYVCRVFDKLRSRHPGLTVKNLGLAAEPGEDSCSFRAIKSCYGISTRRDVSVKDTPPYSINKQSQLSAALAFLHTHGRRVRYITLDLGGNDFDPLVTEALQGHLVQAIGQLPPTQARFRLNYGKIVATISQDAPKAKLVLIDQYNPLSGVSPNILGSDGKTISRLSAQTLGTFASTVKSVAASNHATFVDVRPPFAGHALDLTWLTSNENIHPNTKGYRLYADAVLKALHP